MKQQYMFHKNDLHRFVHEDIDAKDDHHNDDNDPVCPISAVNQKQQSEKLLYVLRMMYLIPYE